MGREQFFLFCSLELCIYCCSSPLTFQHHCAELCHAERVWITHISLITRLITRQDHNLLHLGYFKFLQGQERTRGLNSFSKRLTPPWLSRWKVRGDPCPRFLCVKPSNFYDHSPWGRMAAVSVQHFVLGAKKKRVMDTLFTSMFS